jgi:hypothetical protein
MIGGHLYNSRNMTAALAWLAAAIIAALCYTEGDGP